MLALVGNFFLVNVYGERVNTITATVHLFKFSYADLSLTGTAGLSIINLVYFWSFMSTSSDLWFIETDSVTDGFKTNEFVSVIRL